QIKGALLKHPFYDKQVPLLIGDYVTTDSGTGAVHTAPAHGHDDFMMGKKFGLPLESPVNEYGVYEEGTELFSGHHISKVDDQIIETLKENKTLANNQKFMHSYPHCWRHKTPLIFRATRQWFIAMEGENFRDNCLNAIKEVEWFPSWGEERIEGMVSGRPDWCISRQRYWGVPIPLFIHKKTKELHPETTGLLKLIANRIEEDGINTWFEADINEFINDDANEYIKSSDTMDVWMDSGLAHHAVNVNFDCIEPVADLYLEGSDQHRGWFQSSLLTSVAMHSRAPYKQVLTHGFTVDESGKKMSKSEGNVIAPQTVINNLGADILRLWAASTDYSKEMNISDQILKRNSDAYRRIRNTARFLLSNLSDFDPDKEVVKHEDLLLLDQWVLNRLLDIDQGIKKDYDNYSFHRVSQTLHNFCVVDMGGFYLDVIKDRLYTMQKDSLGRKSAQTLLYYISELLVRWISPILSYTSEEIWKYLPGEREESIFLTQWYELSKIDIKSEWKTIHDLNEVVSKSLEIARDQNIIGSSLDAELILYLSPEMENFLKPLRDELHFLFITSTVKLKKLSEMPKGATQGENFAAVVKSVDENKCNRCWHKNSTVGQSKQHPELCSRCEDNISKDGESRSYF
ncbi:MAG: isoleucine--tRNA ligase, partial [Gammaproteobacteria bacterium]|nr:isoleucine--tRNA ligase [Gammaproteobacteria bacterium]